MPSKNITFDPDAGVPKGANFTLHTGADFHANFNVVNTANSAFNFTGYSGSAQVLIFLMLLLGTILVFV